MDPLDASRQLEAIRTLMERAALYRRALAPTTLLAGALGTAAAVAGWFADLTAPRAFGIFWIVVGAVAVTGAMLLMRRQALRELEPFWSPPARRVARAVAPLFLVGLVVGLLAIRPEGRNPMSLWWLPPIWMVLYGAGLHAAGFFLAHGGDVGDRRARGRCQATRASAAAGDAGGRPALAAPLSAPGAALRSPVCRARPLPTGGHWRRRSR